MKELYRAYVRLHEIPVMGASYAEACLREVRAVLQDVLS